MSEPRRRYCPICGRELCRAYYADDVLHCPRCGPAVYLGQPQPEPIALPVGLPGELYERIARLGFFARPLRARPDQVDAAAALHRVANQGPAEAVPATLRQIGMAWVRDAHGEAIPLARNWVRREAFALATEVEAWLEEKVTSNER